MKMIAERQLEIQFDAYAPVTKLAAKCSTSFVETDRIGKRTRPGCRDNKALNRSVQTVRVGQVVGWS